MLKVIAFENFVHFKDKQVINFESTKRRKKTARRRTDETEETAEKTSDDAKDKNKLNFFVGANFCGKSTVLELIRRCMTKEINVTKTRSFNDKKVAYVFCKFYLNSEEFISGVIKDEKGRFFKILIYTDENRKILRYDSSDSTLNEGFRSFAKQGDEDVLKHIFDKGEKESTYIERILNKIQSKEEENELNWDFLKYDWEILENKYVATMPLRGIGTVQWTKSDKLRNKDNYEMACKRAEIITELFSKPIHPIYGEKEDPIDREKEEKVFDYLTNPQKFVFLEGKDKKEILVQHIPSDPFPLLKTSEGILEAKQVSLLLAHKDFKTICLEEPDRGMHAQMIERLRAILYQEGLEKTIIVSTHSRYFIDISTMNNTHVFFRTESNDPNYSCKVRNVGLQNELAKVSDVETLRNLLFSTKVLLVEGPTDRDVVQALFTHLRGSPQEEIDIEKPDITTYQIIPIGGCQSAKNVLKFCKYINLPSLCVLDLDYFVPVKKIQSPRGIIFQWVKWVITPFKGMVDWFTQKIVYKSESVSLDDDAFDAISATLREEKIFIWRCGALEDAILSSENMNEKIAESLNINLSDTTTRCKTLKSKLKQKLDEEERRLFCEHLSKVKEINRFLAFMEEEEKERIENSNVFSDSA